MNGQTLKFLYDRGDGEMVNLTDDASSLTMIDGEPSPEVEELIRRMLDQEPITASFSFTVNKPSFWVDMEAMMMTRLDVWRFELVHALGNSHYSEYCYRRYAAQFNHSHRARAVSWRRLNWKQKARAIAMADRLNWYDDYYYGG